jgi:hypothetical protein
MLAKKRLKDKMALPMVESEHVTLHSPQRSCADEVRARLAQCGIEKQDVKAAVAWARNLAN